MRALPESDEPILLGGGETLVRELDLMADEFLHVRADQQGIDVVLMLGVMGGESVVRFDSPNGRYGPEELLFIAPSAGRYELKLETPRGDVPEGYCRVRTLAKRPALQADRELLRADTELRAARRRLKSEGLAADELRTLEERLLKALDVFERQSFKSGRADALATLGDGGQRTEDLEKAAGFLRAAAEGYREASDPHAEARLLTHLGFVELQLGRPQEAKSSFLGARAAAERLGNAATLADAVWGLGCAAQALGNRREALTHLEEARQRLERLADPIHQARFFCDLGSAHLAYFDPELASKAYEAAVSLLAQAQDHPLLPTAWLGLADSASQLGHHDEAERVLNQALSALVSRGRRRDLALANQLRGELLRRRGNFQAAAQAYEEAVQLAREARDRRTEGIALIGWGDSLRRLGEAEAALPRLEEAEDTLAAIGDIRYLEAATVRRAEALRDLKRLEEAWQLLRARLHLEELGNPSAAKPLPMRPEYCEITAGILMRLGEKYPQAGWATLADRLRELQRGWEGAGLSWGMNPGGIEDPTPPPVPANLARSDTPDEEPLLRSPPRAALNQRGDTASAEELDRSEESGEGASRLEEANGGDEPGLAQTADAAELGRWVWESLSTDREAHEAIDLCREYEEVTDEDLRAKQQRRELPFGTNPHVLAETGWACIYASDEDPLVLAALEDLFALRSEQAGRRFRKLDWQPGETIQSFLWYRHGESPGVLDVDALPYYLLIIGGPDKVPFELQYQLSINHAVGRICLESPADYEVYARCVVDAEREGTRRPRQAMMFAVENADWATHTLAEHLAAPLAKSLDKVGGFNVELLHREQATRARLRRALDGETAPGVLLVSCHGKSFHPDDARQRRTQGALVCQGEEPLDRQLPDPRAFGADELPPTADLSGLVVFLFSCHGAGTPESDNFPQEPKSGAPRPGPRAALRRKPRRLAQAPFVAALPQALLRQGALAVVGHVDRGWTTGYHWKFENVEQPTPQPPTLAAIRSLEDSLKQFLSGHRLGHAFRPLHRRYSNLAALLASTLDRARRAPRLEDATATELGWQWTAHHDARNFIILGDPAIYALGRPPEGTEERFDALQAGRVVALDENLLARVHEAALAEGRSLEDWVSEVLWARLGGGS